MIICRAAVLSSLLPFQFMTIDLMGSNRNSAKMIVQYSPLWQSQSIYDLECESEREEDRPIYFSAKK